MVMRQVNRAGEKAFVDYLDATIEDLYFKAPRGVDRSFILRRWIRDGQTVLVSGATGSGKSYLPCALDNS